MPIIKIQRVFYEVSWNYEMTQVLFKRNLPLNVALTSGGKGSVSARLIFLELCWVVCWCSPIVYRKKKNASDLASVLIVASCKVIARNSLWRICNNWFQPTSSKHIKKVKPIRIQKLNVMGMLRFQNKWKDCGNGKRPPYFLSRTTTHMAKYVNTDELQLHWEAVPIKGMFDYPQYLKIHGFQKDTYSENYESWRESKLFFKNRIIETTNER